MTVGGEWEVERGPKEVVITRKEIEIDRRLLVW